MAVVGVPKTIDNDILHMDKTFGFDTAVEEAQRAINSAYIEVEKCALNSLVLHTRYFKTDLNMSLSLCMVLVIRHIVLIMELAL